MGIIIFLAFTERREGVLITLWGQGALLLGSLFFFFFFQDFFTCEVAISTVHRERLTVLSNINARAGERETGRTSMSLNLLLSRGLEILELDIRPFGPLRGSLLVIYI